MEPNTKRNSIRQDRVKCCAKTLQLAQDVHSTVHNSDLCLVR